MEITEHILTQNDCYKAGRTITPKGIMVHSMGVAQPKVEVFLDTWNKPNVNMCGDAPLELAGVARGLAPRRRHFGQQYPHCL